MWGGPAPLWQDSIKLSVNPALVWWKGRNRAARHLFFTVRVTEPWNRLLTGVVELPSLEILKNHLGHNLVPLCSRMTLLERDIITDNPCYPFQTEPVTGQENLLANNTFFGRLGTVFLSLNLLPQHNLGVYPPCNSTLHLSFHHRICGAFEFSNPNFLGIWTISHIKKWSHTSNFVGQLAL